MFKNIFQLDSAVSTQRHGYREVIRNLRIIVSSLFGAVILTELIYTHLAAPQNLILIYVLAILVISVFTSGYFYSIIGTLAAVVIYDYLIAEPRLGFSFTIGFPITMIIMLMVSLTTCTLVAKIKKTAIKAVEANRKTETIYGLITNFVTAYDQETLAHIAAKVVMDHIHRDVFFYLGDPAKQDSKCISMRADDAADTAFPDEMQREIASKAYQTKSQSDNNFAEVSCWRLATGNELLGVMCVMQGDKPLDKDEAEFLQIIAVQTSIFLEKLHIAEHRQKAEIRAETEQIRNSFLRGISHDLRNPLTGILSAASILIDNEEIVRDPTAREMLSGIYSDADWLLRMVENILTITQLQSGKMKVTKKMEAPEELIAYAVSTMRKRHQDIEIHIVAPQELVLVPMDPILITQVLFNFLENAVKHSPKKSEITVTLTIEETVVRISVSDKGPGIVFWEDRDLFEIDPRKGSVAEDSSRGMGMGLSICKAIVTVHGGEIGAENNTYGGARFWFTLPLQA